VLDLAGVRAMTVPFTEASIGQLLAGRMTSYYENHPILAVNANEDVRGGISRRLRTENPQTVASECGTSPRMLSEHYAFAIEDLRRYGPRPARPRVACRSRRASSRTTRARPLFRQRSPRQRPHSREGPRVARGPQVTSGGGVTASTAHRARPGR
jgi:hypothetical protein